MSNKSSLRFLAVLLFAAFVSAALVAADAGALGQNANSSTTEDTTAAAPAQSTEDISGEQVDLSGTYSGRLRTTGSHEMSGDAELTITGNTFTLTGEGMSHTGRVYAVLTRGATSAAFYFADMTDEATKTPVAFNVRAHKRGNRLTLTPAPNTRNRMSFTSGRGRPAPGTPGGGTATNTNTPM